MKQYEQNSPLNELRIDQPFIIRLDGHKFSTFTRCFKKPFDERSAPPSFQ
jgi:tRNA(His) 5'-end guanylyltransferase